MEKLVQLTRGVAHDPGLDGFGQQLAIPSNQMVRVGRSLVARVMRENVVITTRRRARPDVCAAIPVRFRIGKIAVEKRMVQGGAEIAGRKEVDAVQVGDVHAATIGRRCVIAEFVHIQHEQQDVHAVAVLEERDALAPVGERELVGVVGRKQGRDGFLHRHGGHDVAHDPHDQILLQLRQRRSRRTKALRQLLHHLIHAQIHLLRQILAQRTGRDRSRSLDRLRLSSRIFRETDRTDVVVGDLARMDQAADAVEPLMAA